MDLETFTTTSAAWLWEQYGKAITNRAIGELQKKWRSFQWKDAEAKYRARLREQHSTTRLFGNPKLIVIEDIFTDIYVLDRPTAFQRYDLVQLQNQSLRLEISLLREQRRPALDIAATEKRLYILGKPGAGKTTFLKFLTLQACAGKIRKTPIFVSLKEWADSGLELIPFLVHVFEICAFPDAEAFIEHLLGKGGALVLFDGLDEVNQEGDQRAKMILTLTNFAKRYPETQICLTCRIAATDYSFTQFTYLEISNFDERQIQLFAAKWFEDEQNKLDRFLVELNKPENEGLRELGQTPLLLALLCLTFDEIGHFPLRRMDLYKEAIDALLRKWDASRGIRRDEVYHGLSIVRKEQMFARIAAQNFEAGTYFIRQDTLTAQINHYIQQLPTVDVGDTGPPDGEAILKAVEAQHGILVERAHGIYSFSHLTFQEYFTARYIVENAAYGAITRLIQHHVTDSRWHEVFLLIASMLDNADYFIDSLLRSAENLIQDDEMCISLLHWANEKTRTSQKAGPEACAIWLFVPLARALSLASKRVNAISGHLARDTDLDRALVLANTIDNLLDQACSESFRLSRTQKVL